MNTYIRLSGFLILLLGVASCKMLRVTPKSFGEIGRNPTELTRNFVDNQKNFDQVEIRANAKVGDEEQSFMASLTIRIQSSELIWASVRSGIGIELARLKATPDSVWIESKLLKIEEKGDWGLLNDYIGIPLDFASLVSILTRKPIQNEPERLQTVPCSGKGDQPGFCLKQIIPKGKKSSGYLIQYRINRSIMLIDQIQVDDEFFLWKATIDYIGDPAKYIDRINIQGLSAQNKFQGMINYLSFEEREDLNFPFQDF